MFTDYKKHPYKAKFADDNIFWLGSNQRSKLQYHYLAQNFDLVTVAEQDKADLQALCESHRAETA
jgi:hypothetical protein